MPVYAPANILTPVFFFMEDAVLFAVIVAHATIVISRRLVQAPDRMIFQGSCAPAQTEMRRWACGAVFEERRLTLMAHQRLEPRVSAGAARCALRVHHSRAPICGRRHAFAEALPLKSGPVCAVSVAPPQL